jgi:hypothetical protein
MTETEWLQSTGPAAMLRWLTARGESEILGGAPFPPIPSDRKLRLFAVACCRVVWPLLTDARSRRAVEVADRYADGQTLATATKGPLSLESAYRYLDMESAHDEVWVLAYNACRDDLNHLGETEAAVAKLVRPDIRANLLRDVFGNPWRSHRLPGPSCSLCHGAGQFQKDMGHGNVDVDECLYCAELVRWLAWHDGAIPKLAQAMYDSRDFADMPILGDMLTEAGYDDAAILEHCRQGWCNDCSGKGAWREGDVHIVCCHCQGIGSIFQHVRGCWVLDLILGKS